MTDWEYWTLTTATTAHTPDSRYSWARLVISLALATVLGMVLGGWMSGEIYDLTGSYQAAFLNGIAWNLVNMAIAVWLLIGRSRHRSAFAT